MNVGPVFPDERHPVWPRPFAADYDADVTAEGISEDPGSLTADSEDGADEMNKP